MEKKSNIILIAVWLMVVLSFVTTQLTNDFFVFWAYGRLVSNSEATGIASLIDTWEMKGLLFKAYLYVEYALTALFSTAFDTYGQSIYKIIGLIPFLLILGLCIVLLPDRYVPNKINKKRLYFFSSILLLAVHFASHFQAEMWGVLFLLLSFSIYLREGWGAKIVAAIVYSLTFYLKSPIPLLGGSLVIASKMLKKQTIKEAIKDVIPFAIGTIVFLSSSFFLIFNLYPQEINDIWNASYYQHTLFHESVSFRTSFISLIDNGVITISYNPVIGVGIFATLLLIVRVIKEKDWSDITYLVLIWIFPLIYILVSNCFFVYHYYLLAYPSLLTLLILCKYNVLLKKIYIPLMIMFCIYYAFSLSSICSTNLYEREIYESNYKQIKEKNNITVGCKLGNESVLFLDCGIGAFLFSNQSYLRYFYPLPLQRTSKTDKFVELPTYLNTKEKAMNYKGQYVVLEKEWFLKNGNNDDLFNKICNEYNLEKEINVPKYSWSLFDEEPLNGSLLIYKRK